MILLSGERFVGGRIGRGLGGMEGEWRWMHIAYLKSNMLSIAKFCSSALYSRLTLHFLLPLHACHAHNPPVDLHSYQKYTSLALHTYQKYTPPALHAYQKYTFPFGTLARSTSHSFCTLSKVHSMRSARLPEVHSTRSSRLPEVHPTRSIYSPEVHFTKLALH